MKQREPSAAVFLDQRERRTAHFFSGDPESFGQSTYECRLPCSQVAIQEQNVTGGQGRRNLSTHRSSLVFRAGRDRPSFHRRFGRPHAAPSLLTTLRRAV